MSFSRSVPGTYSRCWSPRSCSTGVTPSMKSSKVSGRREVGDVDAVDAGLRPALELVGDLLGRADDAHRRAVLEQIAEGPRLVWAHLDQPLHYPLGVVALELADRSVEVDLGQVYAHPPAHVGRVAAGACGLLQLARLALRLLLGAAYDE